MPAERRRAGDGKFFTFSESAEWYAGYGELDGCVFDKWGQAETEAELACMKLFEEYGNEFLDDASLILRNRREDQVPTKEVWRELLLGAAVRDDTPERYFPLRRAITLFHPWSHDLMQIILHAAPSTARANGAVREAFRLRDGISADVLTDFVSAGPPFGKLFEDKSWGWDAELLAAVLSCFRRAGRGDEISEALPVRLLAGFFTPDRCGMRLIIEAGATTLHSFAVVAEQLKSRNRSAVLGTLHAWRHGEVAQHRFLLKSVSQRTTVHAARVIATFVYGECACSCPSCRRHAAAMGHFLLAKSFSCIAPRLPAHTIATMRYGECLCSCPCCLRRTGTSNTDSGLKFGPAPEPEVDAGEPDIAPENNTNIEQVLEYVPHTEPAAVIDPLEAATIVELQWTSAIDRLMGTAPGALDGGEANVTGLTQRVVLLEFGRRPKEMYDALLTSNLAVRLQDEGVDLQPSWANGKLVLAANVTEDSVSEAPHTWHVAVHESDEEIVYAAIRALGHNVRPRLKNGSQGRFLIPDVTSFMKDTSEDAEECASVIPSVSDGDEASDEEQGSPCNSTEWGDVPVLRTFIHIPCPRQVTPRTSVSAPPGM